MAGSLNRVSLIGNLGRDPEIRTTQNGSRVASFSIATSETWKDKSSGEKKERTDWHNIVCWSDGLVGVVEQYLKKGSKVYVEGKLQTRKWQDQSGVDRYSTEVVIQGFGGQVILLGGGGNRPPPGEEDDYREPNGAQQPSRPGPDLDDDIPF